MKAQKKTSNRQTSGKLVKKGASKKNAPKTLQDEAEIQRQRAAERIQKLRNLSSNINAANSNNEFETVPAYTPSDYLIGGGNRTITLAKEFSPVYSVSSKLRDIGNSKGVILNNRVIAQAGITPEADLIIHASDGVVIIQVKETANVNTNLSSWDAQYKKAMKKGKRPEGDVWEGMENKFDQEEWT
jgi:antitoxin component of MazEF toxin-antitoxin module